MRIKHTDKVKIARRMASGRPKKSPNIFTTQQWMARKNGIAHRVAKAEAKAHARALARKEKRERKPSVELATENTEIVAGGVI